MESALTDVLRDAILALPQDLKVFLRLAEDPDLEERDRTLLCGVLLHLLSGANAIPGTKGLLAFSDDVILMRLALRRLKTSYPDILAQADGFVSLEDELRIFDETLGTGVQVLEKSLDALVKISHQGHSARQCSESADEFTWLYESIQEATVSSLDYNEDEVGRAVKTAGDIPTYLKQKR